MAQARRALLLLAAAHWIPEEAVASVLRPDELQDWLPTLLGRGLVRTLDTGAIQIGAAAREALIGHALSHEPETFRAISSRLAQVFSELPIVSSLDYIEGQFHRLVADPRGVGAQMFREAVDWSSDPIFRFELLARLLQSWEEQRDRGLLEGEASDYLRFCELLVPVGRLPPRSELDTLDQLGLTDDPLFRAEVNLRKGLALTALDDRARAEAAIAAAEQIFQKADDRRGLVKCFRAAGRLHIKANRFQEAQRDFSEAEQLADKLGLRESYAQSLRGLAETLYYSGDYEEADTCFKRAVTTFEASSSRIGLANALVTTAHLLMSRGDPEAAAGAVDRAASIYSQIQQRLGLANTHKARATIWILRLNPDRASEALEVADDLYGVWKSSAGPTAVKVLRARILRLQKDMQGAEKMAKSAMEDYDAQDDIFGLASACREIGLSLISRASADAIASLEISAAHFRDVKANVEAAISSILAARCRGEISTAAETVLTNQAAVVPADMLLMVG